MLRLARTEAVEAKTEYKDSSPEPSRPTREWQLLHAILTGARRTESDKLLLEGGRGFSCTDEKSGKEHATVAGQFNNRDASRVPPSESRSPQESRRGRRGVCERLLLCVAHVHFEPGMQPPLRSRN